MKPIDVYIKYERKVKPVNKNRELAGVFLKKHGMDASCINFRVCCDIFMEEMIKGLEGRESSLEMIPTYISPGRGVPGEEPVIVVDAGGTNFRVALVSFDVYKKPVIRDYMIYPMPGSKGQVSKDEFFRGMVEYLKPVINKGRKIGFCFSYAVEMLPNKDGKLLKLSKEIRVRDMEGVVIGQSLQRALKDTGYPPDKEVVLLNDTTAALLGGMALYNERSCDSYIGFVLGTGTNTCYIEENSNIKKIPALAANGGLSIINIESGGYNKMPSSDIDTGFDAGTENPGEYKFEKMTSGRYIGGLILETVKKAAEEGLFSEYFENRIKDITRLETAEADRFLCNPYGDCLLCRCCMQDSDDAIVLYYIIDSILERAAKLITINLASIMLKIKKGQNPCKPVCITAEGSTFYKLKSLRNKLEYYIKQYINDELGIYCEYVKVEDATLIGAAIAGLSI